MKYLIFVLIVSFFIACEDKPNRQRSPLKADPQGKSPVPVKTDSPELLKDFLRQTLRSELDFTIPEQRQGLQTRKSYSFDVEENNGRPTWVIKEKYHDVAGKLFAGAEYLLLWDVVDKNTIKLINAADGQKTAIRIGSTAGDAFVYHPYSNDPDTSVDEVIIGWYDRGQDAALLRAYTYLLQLAENMGKR